MSAKPDIKRHPGHLSRLRASQVALHETLIIVGLVASVLSFLGPTLATAVGVFIAFIGLGLMKGGKKSAD